MYTVNYARVYVGKYSYGHIAFMPDDDTYHEAKCGYRIVSGQIIIRHLRPVRIRGADDEGKFMYYMLENLVLRPNKDDAVITIFSRYGRHTIRLARHKLGTPNKVFKMEL
jgi:hypothetical protein